MKKLLLPFILLSFSFILAYSQSNVPCSPSTPITCGETVSFVWPTGDHSNFYPECNNNLWQPGYEKVFQFSLSQPAEVTFTHTSNEIRQFVSGHTMVIFGGCSSSYLVNCLDLALDSFYPDDFVQIEIVLTLSPGTYYIVLDSYRLTSSSNSPNPERNTQLFNTLSVDCDLSPCDDAQLRARC